jgi:phytoene/squalene synthetase
MIAQSNERNRQIMRRIRDVTEQRAKGRSYTDIAESQPQPLIIELATDNLEELMEAAGRLRRAQAAALHDEGVTMDRIAELFGVTRQRISQILRQREAVRNVA